MTGAADLFWDTSISRQVSNCDGVVLDIDMDQKLHSPQRGFDCDSLAWEVVT